MNELLSSGFLSSIGTILSRFLLNSFSAVKWDCYIFIEPSCTAGRAVHIFVRCSVNSSGLPLKVATIINVHIYFEGCFSLTPSGCSTIDRYQKRQRDVPEGRTFYIDCKQDNS